MTDKYMDEIRAKLNGAETFHITLKGGTKLVCDSFDRRSYIQWKDHMWRFYCPDIELMISVHCRDIKIIEIFELGKRINLIMV